MSISTGNPEYDASLSVGLVALILFTMWIISSKVVDWLYRTGRITDKRKEAQK